MRKSIIFTALLFILLLQVPLISQAQFPYDVNNLGLLSNPIEQWEVSSAVLPGTFVDQWCSAIPNRQTGDPQFFLSYVSDAWSLNDATQRLMSCPLSLLGSTNCDGDTNAELDLVADFGTCTTSGTPIYVATSNDNIMMRLRDGRLVQVVQTIKLNCPRIVPPKCGIEDREQVSYVVRVSNDCGQNWTPSVIDASAFIDDFSQQLKGFDRVEAYADPWSDHILLTSAGTGTNECSGAQQTSFFDASTAGGTLSFNWQQTFNSAPPGGPTAMTSLPHSGGTSRVYWFNCRDYSPTLFFADDPWNGGAIQIHELDTLLQNAEGDQTTSINDFGCMGLPSAHNLCEPGLNNPNCFASNTEMGQGIHWECHFDPNFAGLCPAGTNAETVIRNLIGNNAIARVSTNGTNDVIRVAYPQLIYTQNRYFQTVRIVDVEITPDGSGGYVVTPRTNRIIDAATGKASPASVFYPSIIQVDQTTTDDPTASTHMVRWTEIANDGVGNAVEMLSTWDTEKSWVGSSDCPQYGVCSLPELWNPDREIDRWPCAGGCSPGDYQYGAFIDTLDECTHNFFVPWGVQDAVSGTRTHGAIVRTTTDNLPPVYDSAPMGETVSCHASVPAPPLLTASDYCDDSVDVAFTAQWIKDSICTDKYTLERLWTATDNVGNIVFENQTIEVNDEVPPTLSALPGNQTVECDVVPAPAQLTASDNCDQNPQQLVPNENRIDGSCPSNYQLNRTWVATDQCKNETTWSQLITVQDTTDPLISSITASPNIIWSPDHKMVSVSVNVTASDNCNDPVCSVISVESNEPVNGLGDGDTTPDWEIIGDLTVNLRAERSGMGNGRIYTITTTCNDGCGNSVAGSVNVSVPHEQMK